MGHNTQFLFVAFQKLGKILVAGSKNLLDSGRFQVVPFNSGKVELNGTFDLSPNKIFVPLHK